MQGSRAGTFSAFWSSGPSASLRFCGAALALVITTSLKEKALEPVASWQRLAPGLHQPGGWRFRGGKMTVSPSAKVGRLYPTPENASTTFLR